VERAEALLKTVSDAGFEGRLVRVPGSDLIRVRVGTFDSAEGANDILWKLRGLEFTAQLARDAQREERVIR
jgi:cell division protein FtsN